MSTKYKLLFSALPSTTLPDNHFSLLERIWQRGQALKNSKEAKATLGEELNLVVKEALIMDGAFLLVVGPNFENVYEITDEGKKNFVVGSVTTQKTEYTKGPSKWTNSSGIVGKDGKAQLITIKDGKFKS